MKVLLISMLSGMCPLWPVPVTHFLRNSYIWWFDCSVNHRLMIIFIITRILDVFTTYLNVNNFGWDVESNPSLRYLGNNGLFIPYQILITILGIIVVEHCKFKKQIYIALSIISLIAVCINIYCYIFIK